MLKGRFYQALLYIKVTKALKIYTQGQKQLKDRISKLLRADKWIRSLVSPVQQMSLPRRQTHQVRRGQARIGTISHAEMAGQKQRLIPLQRSGTHSVKLLEASTEGTWEIPWQGIITDAHTHKFQCYSMLL